MTARAVRVRSSRASFDADRNGEKVSAARPVSSRRTYQAIGKRSPGPGQFAQPGCVLTAEAASVSSLIALRNAWSWTAVASNARHWLRGACRLQRKDQHHRTPRAPPRRKITGGALGSGCDRGGPSDRLHRGAVGHGDLSVADHKLRHHHVGALRVGRTHEVVASKT